MVGIVIVSHSARLAEGVAELAREAGGNEVPLAATGGLDLAGRPLGTDAALVLQALDQVYSDDGVLVLMDLGSAVLSAEMAVEMLPAERRPHVMLCEAPLVEGAVAAAVQARLGSPLSQVVEEARGALAAKAAQLNPDAGMERRPTSAAGESPMLAGTIPSPAALATGGVTGEVRLVVAGQDGLHARPASQFVRVAGWFRTEEIAIRNLTAGRGPVNAKSLTSILILGVRQGDEVLLTASGPNATGALDALRAFVDGEL